MTRRMGRRKKAATLRVVCCALFKALLDAKAMKRGDAERFRLEVDNMARATMHVAVVGSRFLNYLVLRYMEQGVEVQLPNFLR